MPYLSKMQTEDGLLDLFAPPDLTDEEKAEYRSRIGASSSESSGAPVRVDVSIAASAWSGGAVTLTSADDPALSNVAANSLVQFVAADASAQTVVQSNVRMTGQGAGSVTFLCDSVPASAVNGTLVIFN